MTENKKISYITFLQSFAVTLVVLGHSFPHLNGMEILPAWANVVFKIIYSFHMPLFFALAGFLFINTLQKREYTINYKKVITNKIIRLLIPYFTIGTISYLLKIYLFNSFAYRAADTGIKAYVQYFLYPHQNANSYMWFLPVIFLVYIIMFSFYKYFRKENICKIAGFCFAAALLSVFIRTEFLAVKNIVYFSFYFALGAILFFYKKIFEDKFFLWSIVFLFAEIIVLVFAAKFVLIKILAAAIGILFSFSLAYFFDKKGCKFLGGIIDGEYYQIYLLSWFAQMMVRIFYQMGKINYPVCSLLMFINAFIFTKLICFIITRFFPKLNIFIGLPVKQQNK